MTTVTISTQLNPITLVITAPGSGSGGASSWGELTDKPTSFPSTVAEVVGLQGSLDAKANASHAHTVSEISDSTETGRSVLTATDQSAARTAIGAGTSNLTIGTTGSTAKAGNYAPTVADIPAGSTISVYWTGSAWPSRPTVRTDVTVQWIGGTEANPPSAGVAGKDIWVRSTV